MTDTRPPPEPTAVADDGVTAVIVGTVAWAVALVVSLLAHRQLAEADMSWLIWTCGAGIIIGLITFGIVWRRHLVYKQHRDALGVESHVDSHD